MKSKSYTNYADEYHKRWLSGLLGGLVKPQHFGPDLMGQKYAIEIKARNIRVGFKVQAQGFNSFKDLDALEKFYALMHYELKKTVSEIETPRQIYPNIFGREVYFVDFDFVDFAKGESRPFKHKRGPLGFYNIYMRLLRDHVQEKKDQGILETLVITTFGLEDRIIFCTENADELKEQIKKHPRFVRSENF